MLFASAGLLVTYLRLRQEFDRPLTLLTLALLAGATPLWAAILRPSLSATALFAVLAGIVYLAETRLSRPLVRALVVRGAVLAIPVIAQDTAARPTLFSPANGFLALTPVVYVAVIGTLARSRGHGQDTIALLLALIVWPFTHTPLVSAVALIAPGLAAVLAWVRRRPLLAVTPIVVTAIAWNYWLMVQYTAGTIPKDAPTRFADMVRQQADVHTRQPFVYAFAFPGNLLAAWREGVPLLRYDQLSVEPQREEFELDIDRNADRFLLDGWGPLGSNARGSYRLITNEPASLVFPLRVADGALDVGILAAVRGGSPHATARLEVNGHTVGEVRLSPVLSEARVHVKAPDVGRIFRAGYNRLSIVPSGAAPIALFRFQVGPAA